MKKHIKFMADYECWPLWWSKNHSLGNVNPGELPISQELAERIELWAITYDGTLNQIYPPDSGFQTQREVEAFINKGSALSARLQEELGEEYVVIYDVTGIGIAS